MTNPFISGKLISVDTDPRVYRRNGVRGSADYTLTRSDLASFSACPLKWLKRGPARETTDSLEFGSTMDALVLQPAKFAELVSIVPETYTDSKGNLKDWTFASTTCRKWRQEQEGKLIINLELYDKACEARDRLLANQTIAQILKASDKQVYCVATYWDEATDMEIGVKVLIDIAPHAGSNWEHSLMDLKTCRSAAPRLWGRAVWEYGLALQAAIYMDVFAAATGRPIADFRHILVENTFPFLTSARVLSSNWIDDAKHVYVDILQRYCQCLKSGEWPSYPEPTNAVLVDDWPVTEPEHWMIDRQF